jgi:hypothetical protein
MSAFLLWVAVTPLCFFAYLAAFLHGVAAEQGAKVRWASTFLCVASFACMYLAMLLVAWFA